ncbi:HD domain-containing protein [Streptomyces sp. WAC05374]|uniref:HD domain-containing protein n=1 Tax=Streptomyces sp. WAC05374 TaxID=2487420 RepID=UPI000F8697BF|nr:HD domain-containing protein [Streptomyces sp. WAC05374]RST06815.1 HD domain-containing protein [Streptomyces sp. WAC05374]TDF36934.1 HD domain-containing protein [Streptomyces sp. WAC05374]TDF46429.1 HD domain-containing protein [Streptomyces sp. WAC05374]TDF47530.1 HD domain-containing protein [Streptomyces sp. WAC05374]
MDLDDLKAPATPACATALEVATAYCTPALLNHSVRAYIWAAAHGTARGIAYDPELLWVAAMFHDIALMPEFDSHTVGFDDASGHVAWVFAAGAGWPVPRRRRLVEAVVAHMLDEVDVRRDPEGYLLERSTSLDISGRHMDDFTDAFRAGVLARHPRLGIAEEFLACFRDQADRKPDSSPAAALRNDIAGRILTNRLDTP